METLFDAIMWVRANIEGDERNLEEMERAFVLIFEREPGEQDYADGLWEHLKLGWRTYEQIAGSQNATHRRVRDSWNRITEK